MSFDDLGDDQLAPVIPCDVVQFRFLGISLAGYNALISLAIVVLLLVAIVDQVRAGGRRLSPPEEDCDRTRGRRGELAR